MKSHNLCQGGGLSGSLIFLSSAVEGRDFFAGHVFLNTPFSGMGGTFFSVTGMGFKFRHRKFRTCAGFLKLI